MILLIWYWLETVFVSVLKLLLCLRGFHVSNVIVPEMTLEFIISVLQYTEFQKNKELIMFQLCILSNVFILSLRPSQYYVCTTPMYFKCKFSSA